MYWQTLCIFFCGGALYVAVELLWRGRSHGSMFLLGGAGLCLLGALDALWPGVPLSIQAVLGGTIVTALELGCGLCVNRTYCVWDYRAIRGNFRGQICLPYFAAWCALSAVAVRLEDVLRLWLFACAMPPLRIF